MSEEEILIEEEIEEAMENIRQAFIEIANSIYVALKPLLDWFEENAELLNELRDVGRIDEKEEQEAVDG